MTASGDSAGQPFLPVLDVFGDPEMSALFTESALIESWLLVERELAGAQADEGVITEEAASAIRSEAVASRVAVDRLRQLHRKVGYPILPLLELVGAESSAEVGERIHWGATTQDIMDTAMTVRLGRALDLIDRRLDALGDTAAALARRHRSTVMAGRTHGQQAVPTTFGAKVAVWVAEIERHRDRSAALRGRLTTVSLFGAGGTSAAMGQKSTAVRQRLAERLGLRGSDVPWHTARDAIAEAGFVLAASAATCGKIATEVIELSRTEIGEVQEGWQTGRGASSTMPQKANPIDSEVVVSLGIMAAQQSSNLLAAMRVGHERAAGEWQVEWDAIPTIFCLTSAALETTSRVLDRLEVFPARMRDNMNLDGGLIMSESLMMAVARVIGRTAAHERITAVCEHARETGRPLSVVARDELSDDLLAALPPIDQVLLPDSYIGEAERIVDAVVASWRARREPTREGA
jgi:3-carboxy-cis,cis-muconate cycloisomerase